MFHRKFSDVLKLKLLQNINIIQFISNSTTKILTERIIHGLFVSVPWINDGSDQPSAKLSFIQSTDSK